jgi:porin
MPRRRTLKPILILAAACGSLLAEVDDSTEAGTTAVESPFEATLTGDWGGARTTLLNRGVLIEAANASDVFDSLAGGASRRSSVANLFEVALTADLGALAGLRGGKLFVLGFGAHGEDPSEAAGTIHSPGGLAEDEPLWTLAEFWYEQSLFRDRAGLLVGFYAVDSEFDVRETAEAFLNDGFGTGLELAETGRNVDSVFALGGLGIRGRWAASPDFDLRVGVVEGIPGKLDDPSALGLALDADEGVLAIAEAEWRPPGFAFLRLAVGGWHYSTDFERLDGGSEADGTEGVYAFAEGVIFNEPGTDDQGLSGFVRIGRADPSVNPFAAYQAAGLVYTGLLPGREEDLLGLAVSSVANGDDFIESEPEPLERRETVVELTYRIQLRPWLSVQPSLQYARNPGTDAELEDNLSAGVRMIIDF